MANKMLIDASHPEETRVVVLRGNRVEEFDFESANKKQLRGNIYLAKVTRVEPSLQAAFVDYGGNRHGFLAFSEIHPDYYQIPVVDRQALVAEEARTQGDEEEEETRAPRRSRRFRRADRNGRRADKRRTEDETLSEPYEAEGEISAAASSATSDEAEAGAPASSTGLSDEQTLSENIPAREEDVAAPGLAAEIDDFASVSDARSQSQPPRLAEGDPSQDGEREAAAALATDEATTDEGSRNEASEGESRAPRRSEDENESESENESEEEEEHIEQLGGDAMEEVPFRPQRLRRQYKIQEVIKRRQVLLVQVVKEERGSKGAALTTYLSLAGRYSVLMPNTARGGGISRKITDATDRQRLKAIAQDLDVPEGMGVILRTAGASRTKAEVKRDFEYLMRMWETVRETTLRSTAPTLVYEEGSLIKRSIRDLFNKDIDEIIVAGESGFREAKEFMRLLMPSHAKNVQPYRDPQPIFVKSGAEAQLDAMFSNQVSLRSGGYLVINQTEALVAIDVNSGRSTREHNIEDTAARTNLEAAEEVARQLRLRDLAGLIVVDFIDMEESRNNRAVERRLKEALKSDRARIQVGRISHFGLLEMSRQRIRTGVLEGSTIVCPHCAGAGVVRSTSSIALHLLRVIEDNLIKSASHDLLIKTTSAVALYILNQKRGHLRDLEARFGAAVLISIDDALTGGSQFHLDRGEPATGSAQLLAPRAPVNAGSDIFFPEIEEEIESTEAAEPALAESALDEGGESANGESDETDSQGKSESEADGRRRRRRRRRRGRGGDREGLAISANAPQPSDDALGVIARLNTPAPLLQNLSDSEADRTEAPEEVEAPEAEGRETGLAPVGTSEIGPRMVEAEQKETEVETAEAKSEITRPSEAPAPVAEHVEVQAAAAPARRRTRRSAKAAPETAAITADGEPAPELALEVEADRSGDVAPAELIASAEEAPTSPARRTRRAATRPRVSRRAAAQAAAEAEQPRAEGGETPNAAPEPFSALEETRTSTTLSAAEPRDEPTAAAETSNQAEASVRELPEAAPRPAEETPPQPKRSGWWQRARASLKG